MDLRQLPVSQQELADLIASLFEAELNGQKRRGSDLGPLRRYYSKMLDNAGRVTNLAAFAYLQRLWPLVSELRAAEKPLRVLDAGCGYGTESYIMALLGHDVTGLELVSERVEIARSRFSFFESVAAFPLKVRFVNANVLKHLRNGTRYHVIWAMEAISHIYPPESFVRLASGALTEGGTLVISDPNRASPLALWRSIRIRGSLRHNPHRRFADPQTGAPVDYGQEQITSPWALGRMLKREGFKVRMISMSGFMGTTLLPSSMLQLGAVSTTLKHAGLTLAGCPAVRRLGSVYTLVAEKVGTDGERLLSPQAPP